MSMAVNQSNQQKLMGKSKTNKIAYVTIVETLK